MDSYTWIYIGCGCCIIGGICYFVKFIQYSTKIKINTWKDFPKEVRYKILKPLIIFIIAGAACIIIGASTDTGNYGNDPLNGHSQEEYDNLVHEYSKPWK